MAAHYVKAILVAFAIKPHCTAAHCQHLLICVLSCAWHLGTLISLCLIRSFRVRLLSRTLKAHKGLIKYQKRAEVLRPYCPHCASCFLYIGIINTFLLTLQ